MTGEIVFYQSDDGTIRLETRLENETLWLTQQQMAELFQTSVPNISMHVKNVFDEGELQPEATVQDFLIVRSVVSGNFARLCRSYVLNSDEISHQIKLVCHSGEGRNPVV